MRIAYSEEKNICLIDIDGNIKQRIDLPIEIGGDFILKDDVVCFVGKDRQIHWYNWKAGREERLPRGPYIYKDSRFNGLEVYNDIDIDTKNKKIAFSLGPEYSFTEDKDPKDRRKVPDSLNDSLFLIGLIDIRKNEFIQVTKQDRSRHPAIFRDKIVYVSAILIIIKDIETGNETNISDRYKEYYRIQKRYVYLNVPKMENGKVFFAEHSTDVPALITRICSYALGDGTFEIVHDLEKEFPKEMILLDWADIAEKGRFLLAVNNSINELYFYDLKVMRKKVIHTPNKLNARPKFYVLND